MANFASNVLRYGMAHPGDPAQWVHTADGWTSLSYEGLSMRVASLAQWLRQQNITPGDRVALMAPTSPEWVWADLAVLALGAVVVPIYTSLQAAQVTEVLEDSGTRFAVVANAEHEAKLPVGFPHLVMSYPRWDQAITQASRPDLPTWLDEIDTVPGDHMATLVYTSGTTAHSRGVILTHSNLCGNLEGLDLLADSDPTIRLTRRDRALAVLPMAHIFERLVHHYMLGRGVGMYYTSPDRLAEDITSARPTVLVSVPRIYERVFAAVQAKATGPLSSRILAVSIPVARRRADRLTAGTPPSIREWLAERACDLLVYRKIRQALGGSLRFAYSGGAPLHPDLARFFVGAGIPVLEGYGLTETAPVVSVNTLKTLAIGTVGRPLPNVRVTIAEDGEVWCQGPNVMAGYWRRPEETADVLVDGWFHTGDIGELLPSGHLRIVDRQRAILVLSTGKNVVPLAICQALEASPWIEQAMLLGDRRKYVAALLAPDLTKLRAWAESQGLSALEPAALLRHPACLALIDAEIAARTASFAAFERPKRWAWVTEPFTEENGQLTPTLKIKTRVVEERYRELITTLYPDDDLGALATPNTL